MVTREERTEKLRGDYHDDFCGVDDRDDGREPVNTETSILRRLDNLETRDMNGELDKEPAELPWHFDAYSGHIFDSEGRFVAQCKDARRFDFYRQMAKEHNMALAGAALITIVHCTDDYDMPHPIYEAFCALRRAWAS